MKTWTKEEIDFLKDHWGTSSQKSIAHKLNRTVNAIIIKRQRLGLGAMLNSGEYVTVNQLKNVISGTNFHTYNLKSWCENRGFPIKYKTIISKRVKVVYIEDFWEWAEKNRSILDFSLMEENILGIEPAWVKKQRSIDFETKRKYINTPWTATDDAQLKHLLNKFSYGYDDISKQMHRTCGAIQRRIIDLGLKERPVKAINTVKWDKAEIEAVTELIGNGYSYELIAEKINRSAKAIRGKVYVMFGTESLDKVRKKIAESRGLICS